MASSFFSSIGEIFHTVRNDGILAGGKKAAESLAGIIAGSGTSLALVLTLGLISAVSAGLTQMEYHYQRKKLRHFYREELAAKLGKDPKDLSDKDLNALARGMGDNAAVERNHTISEAIGKRRKQRNFGVVLSVTASIATYALMHTIIPATLFAGFGTTAFLGPITGSMIASSIAGLMIYNTLKKPLHWIAHKMFGLDDDTTHDHIAEIQYDRDKGKAISREQVFSVFAAANRELGELIESRYGRSFDELPVPDKVQITSEIGKLIHIDQLTDSLNQGHINVSELAFAAEGQHSGVAPKAGGESHHSLLGAVRSKVHHLVSHVTHPLQRHHANVEYANEPPQKSFASRVGIARADTALGHVERLEQSRGEKGPVTLH